MPETVDFAFFSAYKIFAPHAGMFYTRPEVAHRFYRADDALLPSAPINWSIELGTQCHEAWAGWLGTMAYLRELGRGDARAAMDMIAEHEAALTRYTLDRFTERASWITLYGRPADRERLPVFAFNLPNEDAELIARHLDARGIEARVGNYYSPRLMKALAPDFGGVAIRLSFAHYTTTDDVDACFAALDAFAKISSA
jgi:selenocysteine lyase/cysteine desulfurase